MHEKMDKSSIVIAKREELYKKDDEYWRSAPIEEKLQTITYLRECFYGEEATTGRIQRVHTMFKLK
ncbi:MAG: hypothetical protein FWC01_05710 [Treponema sp.]|nr:hypothetical protein [Treponema sp.]MCL2252681.1 hypothetical protein [Treponema sp.]